jgi:hypothetical protein
MLNEVELPARFWCGASYQWRNGGGYLTVANGSLKYESDRLMRMTGAVPEITHAGDVVTIVHARLVFPINIGIIVCDETAAVAAHVFAVDQYPRARRALIAAGFTIEDVKTWISRGESMARTLTRERKHGPIK